MIAEKNKYLNSTAQSIYEANQNPWVQLMCERREEEIRERAARLAKRDAKIAEQARQLSEKDQQLFEQAHQLSEKDREIEKLQKQLAQLQGK